MNRSCPLSTHAIGDLVVWTNNYHDFPHEIEIKIWTKRSNLGIWIFQCKATEYLHIKEWMWCLAKIRLLQTMAMSPILCPAAEQTKMINILQTKQWNKHTFVAILQKILSTDKIETPQCLCLWWCCSAFILRACIMTVTQSAKCAHSVYNYRHVSYCVMFWV